MTTFSLHPAVIMFRWMFAGGVILAVVILMFLYLKAREVPSAIGREIVLGDFARPRAARHTVIVPVPALPNRMVLAAVEYARSMSADVIAVHINTEQLDCEGTQAAWKKFVDEVPLIILDSPRRSVLRPLLRFIDEMAALRTEDKVTVVLPELVPNRRWHHLLHNRISSLLKKELHSRPGIVVTTVLYHLPSVSRLQKGKSER